MLARCERDARGVESAVLPPSRAGARAEPVQARVLGGGRPPDLAATGAVALAPAAWPTGEDNVRVTVEDEISLPLLVLVGALHDSDRSTATSGYSSGAP